MSFKRYPSEAVMVFGDSFAGGQMGHTSLSFPERLARKIRRGKPGLQVYARDVLGEDVIQMSARLRQEFAWCQRQKTVVVLWGGCKDTGLHPDGRVPVRAGTVFEQQFRKTLASLPRHVPMFVLGYYRIDETKMKPWPITRTRFDAARTLDFNDIIRPLVEAREHAVFISTAPLIKPTDLVEDGMHLTPFGYSKVVRVLAPLVLRALAEP